MCINKIFLCAFFMLVGLLTNAKPGILTPEKIQEIDKYLSTQKEFSKIPGMSVVIIANGEEHISNYGFSDMENEEPVTSSTLFEIGSNSKAFTGLGIQILEEKGLLSFDDNVSKYIEDFYVNYNNLKTEITIQHLLNHTSGIPYNSIEMISEDHVSIEETVKSIIGFELVHMPGEIFHYATINYNILGFIIEKVSKTPFDQFIYENILNPLDLTNTYIGYQKKYNSNLSEGYKIGFFKSIEYKAPKYPGNVPAGYFITNSIDIAKWLKLQVGETTFFHKNSLSKTHLPNTLVKPDYYGNHYGIGWYISNNDKNLISHGGNNPNYSSHIIFDTDKKIGISILANMNSTYTTTMANGIFSILNNKVPEDNYGDIYLGLDFISSLLLVISTILIIVMGIFIAQQIKAIINGNKNLIKATLKHIIGSIVSVITVILLCYIIYILPYSLLNGLSWRFIRVWAPFNFNLSFLLFILSIFLTVANLQLRSYFKK